MNLLKISTAGVRGIVGGGMNAGLAISFAQAFSTYLEGGTIALARDSRSSGYFLRSAVLSGALSAGTRVIDLGVVPTPTVRIFLRELRADGAILIAAGHNPADWNALKFLRSDGMYLNVRQGAELLEIYNNGEFRKAQWRDIQPLESNSEALDFHLARIEETFDVDAIRARRFKVAVDCCNGTCSRITPRLLKSLGCEVVSVNDRMEKPFPHPPNPTPDNMSQVEALVKAARADIGFAHDAEGERLGIVTETGEALPQEDTFALACLASLESGLREGPIVTNLSTSRKVDRIAERYDTTVYRTAIGQSYVAERARRLSASIAGEGSGQVILPHLHWGPDGIAAIAFFLEFLAKDSSTPSQLVEQLPNYHMVKENLPIPAGQLYKKLQRFRLEASASADRFQVDLTDGVKLVSPDAWVHVRASSTESMIRIIAEAENPEKSEELHRWVHDRIVE